MTDPFSHYDAPYVLGALSREDRAAYESHLRECPACSAAVRELAGLPDLLAQAAPPQELPAREPRPDVPSAASLPRDVTPPEPADAPPQGQAGPPPHRPAQAPPEDVSAPHWPPFASPSPDLPGQVPPPDLLTPVLRRVRRGRRTRNAVTAVSAALAVSACVGLAVVVSRPSPAPAPPPPPSVAMQALGEYPVHADARLAAREWGTKVDMSCSYTGTRSEGEYVLVAIAHDGTETRLATWRAVPDDTARIVVGTRLKQADLSALEVRSGSGKPLLRLTF